MLIRIELNFNLVIIYKIVYNKQLVKNNVEKCIAYVYQYKYQTF